MVWFPQNKLRVRGVIASPCMSATDDRLGKIIVTEHEHSITLKIGEHTFANDKYTKCYAFLYATPEKHCVKVIEDDRAIATFYSDETDTKLVIKNNSIMCGDDRQFVRDTEACAIHGTRTRFEYDSLYITSDFGCLGFYNGTAVDRWVCHKPNEVAVYELKYDTLKFINPFGVTLHTCVLHACAQE